MPDTSEKLFESVNETARITRTALLFLLVVALYLLIIVGTTTDLMLLRGEIVALPLMEVGVPIVAFYIAAPFIFLLLHINLLLRLSQLAETIRQGLEDEHSALVFPFDFARLLLKGKYRWVLWAVVVIQIVLLPIIVLLVLQMSFLAYQSLGITLWHQIIVTADLVSLFLFAFSVRGPLAERKIDRNDVLKIFFQVSSAIFVFYFTWTIAVVPNSWQEMIGFFVATLVVLFFPLRFYVVKCLRNNQINRFFSPTKSILLCGLIMLSIPGIIFIATYSLQEEFIQRQWSAYVFADWWEDYPLTVYRPFRRYLKVVEQPIALKEAPPEIVGALIRQTREFSPDIPCPYIGELDLSRRQLNYAFFYKSQFRCVKLEEAKLYDADLRNVKLHGANLRGSHLHGANLQRTELHGANLRFAELHGADLSEAELYGADLFDAGLHGANLRSAKLYGANLSSDRLHGANLRSAKLHGADLSFAILHGADLSFARLHGANLSGAMLKDTNLSDVHWDKPDHWGAIKGNIRDGLKKRGVTDDVIDDKLSQIQEIATDGFSPPTTPTETYCVFHSGKGPFKKWPSPVTDCDLEFISSIVEVACLNQWTAKGIVNSAIFDKDIHLIEALLLRKDCSVFDSYREKLSKKLKKLNK